MWRGFVGVSGALAPVTFILAVFWAGVASADSLESSRDISRHDARCRNPDRDASSAGAPVGCVRIRGYIPAESDHVSGASLDRPPSPFEPLIRPIVTGIGVVAAPLGSALGQVPFFVPVRENQELR